MRLCSPPPAGASDRPDYPRRSAPGATQAGGQGGSTFSGPHCVRPHPRPLLSTFPRRICYSPAPSRLLAVPLLCDLRAGARPAPFLPWERTGSWRAACGLRGHPMRASRVRFRRVSAGRQVALRTGDPLGVHRPLHSPAGARKPRPQGRRPGPRPAAPGGAAPGRNRHLRACSRLSPRHGMGTRVVL